MLIIGCDYHPGFQQIAYVDTETGELQERRLRHPEEAEKFYRDLGERKVKARVGNCCKIATTLIVRDSRSQGSMSVMACLHQLFG